MAAQRGAEVLVRIERAGVVGTVVMQRPPANAMVPELVDAIADAVAELGADPEVRVIVVRSALERIFMAGADLGEMAGRMGGADDAGGAGDSAGGAAQVGRLGRRLTDVERVEKPTIAAIAGHALGGGCELALCCDYRLMVDDSRATIGLTETTLGLIPGGGGTQRLPRLIGRGPGLRMIIEGRRLRAPEALGLGLIDEAIAPDGFEVAVGARAAALGAMATRAVGLAKRAVLGGLDHSLDEGLAIESRAFAEVLTTEDVIEGVGAFLERRQASFRGR